MTLELPPISRDEAWIRRYRGEGMKMFRAAVRASMPEGRWPPFLAVQSEEAKAFFRRSLRLDEWVEARIIREILTHLDGTGEKFIGGTPGSLAAELVAHQPGEHWPSPRVLVEHLPKLWRSRVNGGAVRAEMTGASSARIWLWAIADFDYLFRAWVPAWLERAMDLAGAKGVAVTYRKPGQAESYLHQYDVTWN